MHYFLPTSLALNELQRREHYVVKFTAQEKQLFLPIAHRCLENRPDKRPSSVMLVQELRHIESSLPRGSHVATPIDHPRQLSAKEDDCRQKDEALKEKESMQLLLKLFGLDLVIDTTSSKAT